MKIHELLDSPEKWTQKSFARLADGNPTNSADLDACSWCLTGALFKCYNPSGDVLNKMAKELPCVGERLAPFNIVLLWNDDPNRKYEEVFELVKRLDV